MSEISKEGKDGSPSGAPGMARLPRAIGDGTRSDEKNGLAIAFMGGQAYAAG